LESWSRLAPVVALAALSVWQMGRARRIVIPVGLLVAAAAAYNIWAGGDWAMHYESRFLMPLYPPLLVLAADGCLIAAGCVRRRLTWAQPQLIAALAAAFVTVRLSPVRETRVEWLEWKSPTMFKSDNENNARRAVWLRSHAAPSTVIGLNWAGIPAYFSRLPAVDFLGKCDRHISHSLAKMYWPGHSKWDWDYILESVRPDVIYEPVRGLELREDFKALYEVIDVAGSQLHVRSGSRHKLGLWQDGGATGDPAVH